MRLSEHAHLGEGARALPLARVSPPHHHHHFYEGSAMYAVVINEGPLTAEDNAVYFCNEAPTVKAVEAPVEGREDMIQYVRFVVFTPTNGRQSGCEMRVLTERLVSISGP